MPKSNTPARDNSVIAFIKEAKAELSKVTWPTKEETIRLTTLVVIASIAVGAYLGALDALFTKLMGFIL